MTLPSVWQLILCVLDMILFRGKVCSRYLIPKQRNFSVFQNVDAVSAMLAKDRHWYATEDARSTLSDFASNFDAVHRPASDVADLIRSRCSYISDDVNCENNTALRALSALLTSPLTIASAMHNIEQYICNKDNEHRRSIVILGARAEASLPPVWWRELLLDLRLRSSVLPQRPLDIHFVGPDLPTNIQPIRDFKYNYSDDNRLLAHPSYKTILTSSLFDALPPLAITVLMNPGIGAPSLKSLWEPSLRLLLHRSISPLVFTSHSKGDLERDLLVLKKLANEVGRKLTFIFGPAPNPFASLSPTVDSSEEAVRASRGEHNMRIIYSNAFMYIVNMK